MSDADVDGDEDATRAGRRERDRPASYSQKVSQPACPYSSITDWETASSGVLTGIFQYRSEPTRPKCD